MRWLLVLLVGCGRFGFAPREGVLADGPVDDVVDGAEGGAVPLLRFPFDEPTDTGSVTSVGSLALSTTATYSRQGVPGKIGSAIELAASGHGAEFPDQPELDGFTTLTIETWVYFDQLNAVDYSTFVKKDFGYILRTCDACTQQKTFLSFILWDAQNVTWPATTEIPTPVLGTWYHVAATYDGTANVAVAKTYWNGALVTTATHALSGPLADTVVPLALGRSDISGENLTGRLDELRIWNTVRTDREICDSAGRVWSGAACL
jgi:hypothetical protein